MGKLYRGFDRALGGYLPGGHRPLHETAAEFIGDGINSATDILSGNRDRRFNRDEADKAYERQRELIRDKAGLEMEGLSAAGINPTLAGSGFSGGVPNVHQASHSGSGSGLSGALNSSMSLMSNIVSLRKLMAEVPIMEATARKVNAEANQISSFTPSQLKNLNFQGALLDSQRGQADANTAKSGVESEKMRAQINEILQSIRHREYNVPEFAAKAEFYKRHGENAVRADVIRNPYQGLTFDILGSTKHKIDPNSAADMAAHAASMKMRDDAVNWMKQKWRGATRKRKY